MSKTLSVRPKVEEHEDGSLRVRLPVKVEVRDTRGGNEPPFPKAEWARIQVGNSVAYVGPEGPNFLRRVTETEKL